MSGTDNPDLRAILAGIDRDIAESAKLRYEADKLNQERNKLWHEAMKLEAERDKLRRDRGLAPWIFAVSVISGVTSVIAGITVVLAQQLFQHFTR